MSFRFSVRAVPCDQLRVVLPSLRRDLVEGSASPDELCLLPVVAVECSVVDGFAEVGDADVFAFDEVSDGAADAEDFVMSACRQAHVFHGLFEQ